MTERTKWLFMVLLLLGSIGYWDETLSLCHPDTAVMVNLPENSYRYVYFDTPFHDGLTVIDGEVEGRWNQ